MYKYVLFDLDGTLTDSKEGILNSVAYALEKMGISSEGRLDPHVIVGPPLLDTFEDYYGFEPEKARQAYSFFRNDTARLASLKTAHLKASFLY